MTATILPMSDQLVTTRIDVVDDEGRALDLHFQEYWVRRARRGRGEGRAVRGRARRAARAPGVLEAIAAADAVSCSARRTPSCRSGRSSRCRASATPSPARRDRVAGVSPIVGGAPVRGMADRLMPAAGVEVSAAGAAEAATAACCPGG